MSETYCEIAEGYAVATSSCPATDVVMVVVSSGTGSSSLPAIGFTPQGVVVSSGVATSSVMHDAYAIIVEEATATDWSAGGTDVNAEETSSAVATSSLVFGVGDIVLSVAVASDTVFEYHPDMLVVGSATAHSEAIPTNSAQMTLTSKGSAKSSVLALGLLESVLATAVATDYAFAQRAVSELSTSVGEATGEAVPSTSTRLMLAISQAVGISELLAQVDAYALVEDTAVGESSVWFADPDLKAWVMNTETTAVNWYDNFGFESTLSWQGREFAVGVDGIYELTGATDSGVPINAEVESGFVDFEVSQQKRLDNLYFGYTSDGPLSVKTEVYESGTPPRVYRMDERAAAAPRNNRVTPGKGLYGRYWRLTIANVDGADFVVHDAEVDVAVSARRI